MRILQVTPATYAHSSIIGGGEKLVVTIDHALKTAAAADGLTLETSVLSFGESAGETAAERPVDYQVVRGKPWDAKSIDTPALCGILQRYDVIYVNQALCAVGMLVAAQARLLRKRVVGVDAGGGEMQLLHRAPEAALLYHRLHAISEFAAANMRTLGVPVRVVPGPVDTGLCRPDAAASRNRRQVVALGRILPHKGFDRIIRALPQGLALTVIGQDYDAAYLETLQYLAEKKDVRFRHDLDDGAVRRVLQQAGLFVHASTHRDYRGHFHNKPELLGLAPLEAIACGLPALVSNAGSLPELAALPGCLCFRDDAALAEMLAAHEAGALSWPDAASMHAAVEAAYGPLAFGRGLLAVLLET